MYALQVKNMSVRIKTYIKLLAFPYQLREVKKLPLQNSNTDNLFHTYSHASLIFN